MVMATIRSLPGFSCGPPCATRSLGRTLAPRLRRSRASHKAGAVFDSVDRLVTERLTEPLLTCDEADVPATWRTASREALVLVPFVAAALQSVPPALPSTSETVGRIRRRVSLPDDSGRTLAIEIQRSCAATLRTIGRRLDATARLSAGPAGGVDLLVTKLASAGAQTEVPLNPFLDAMGGEIVALAVVDRIVYDHAIDSRRALLGAARAELAAWEGLARWWSMLRSLLGEPAADGALDVPADDDETAWSTIAATLGLDAASPSDSAGR